MKSDIEIAQSIELQPIVDVVKKIGLVDDDLELYGKCSKCRIKTNHRSS